MVIEGKKIAHAIIEGLQKRPKPTKFLGAVLVGDDPSSASFLRQKEGVAKALGIDFRLYRFSAETKNDDLRREVGTLAAHQTCGGVIVQLPLPAHLNRHYILNVIPQEKDVDVLSERSLGAFYVGRNPILPPAVGTLEKVMQAADFRLESAKVAVLGLGLLVGKPVATWLMKKTKELFLLDQGSDLSILHQADLVISGVGRAGLVKPGMCKEGAGVIDFGYSVVNGKIFGDFDSQKLKANDERPSFYTPTPGGTGPILVAKLFENFYSLNSDRPRSLESADTS